MNLVYACYCLFWWVSIGFLSYAEDFEQFTDLVVSIHLMGLIGCLFSCVDVNQWMPKTESNLLTFTGLNLIKPTMLGSMMSPSNVSIFVTA